jgi:hypothetical protein
MTVSFKQFTSFLAAVSDGDHTDQQLDEIWDKILGKKKEEQDEKEQGSKSKVLTLKDKIAKDKEKAEQRKKELQAQRDKAFLDAKDRAEGRKKTPSSRYDRDDYAIHRQVREGKESFTDEGHWKEAAQSAGFKVKKLSGNLMDGDQTWGAFDGDKKVGEFTEQEEGRGGWLMTSLKEAKNIGFFQMSDASKVEKMDLEKAKEYLKAQVNKTAAKADPSNVRKAIAMIDSAKDVKKLMFGVANFMMSADGNKVIR